MKPILINNLEIAKSQEKLSGEIDTHHCERLAEVLDVANQDKLKIDYALSGSASKFHIPSMELTIDAVLPVVCQRCLEVMQLNISLAFEYVVSKSEPEEFDGYDDIDWLEASREMNISELIEDELLIAMPLAPTHAHDCKPIKLESGEKHNPFAALKGLIK
ncbi:MAG: YceD family protein [Methylophilaceae bacterium]